MKHKVSELDGALLDAAVALAEGLPFVIDSYVSDYDNNREQWVMAARPGHSGPDDLGRRRADRKQFSPSTEWDDGGPIIERERISVIERTTHWVADLRGTSPVAGPTALIAAMRAYVASKLGEEVELPQCPQPDPNQRQPGEG